MIRLFKLITLGCLMATSYILGAMRMQRSYAEPSSPGWEPYRLPRTQPWTQEDVERIVESGGLPPTVPLKLKLVSHHRHHANGRP